MSRARKRVLLLGAGHAHLYSIKRTATFVERGFEVVVVAPDVFWYSGLATGMLGGVYPPALDRIDVGALTAQGGGRFLRDTVTQIDVRARTVHLADGPPLTYDALSLNLGSEVALDLPGAGENVFAVKPISNLWTLRQRLEERLETAGTRSPEVVVVGGGTTAVELAANLARQYETRSRRPGVTVLARGERLLAQVPAVAARRVVRSLTKRGVAFRINTEVSRFEDGAAITGAGERIPFDFAINATGLKPPPLIARAGLPTSGDGSMLVDAHLRSTADPTIHGGGDCIAVEDQKLPKIGVFAIREAPVLFANLLACLEGRPPERFTPQHRWLLILNLGDGTGLATWDRLFWRGRLAFWLKDRIDRRFLASYQERDAHA